MNKFLRHLLIFLLIGYILNLLGGEVLRIKQRVLTAKKLYYPELRMDEFYNLAEDINIVFLGSSRCYQGIYPAVVDSVTGLNSFNLGSSSQTPITSYYILKEVYKYHKPEYVVMEISADVFNTKQLMNGGYILDALRTGKNRLDFFLTGFTFAEQVEILLPVYRYRENRGFFWYSLTEDLDEHYESGRVYRKKGFVENYNQDYQDHPLSFEINDTLDLKMEYLCKINELTKKNGSELVFVYLPYPSWKTIYYKDSLSRFLEDKINGFDREFLNYLEKEDFGDKYFADANHLNLEGARRISEEIGKRLGN